MSLSKKMLRQAGLQRSWAIHRLSFILERILQSSEDILLKNTAVNIAHYHHEKWDGTGYMGLSGTDIKLYARCVALADVFDALVSRRPYKRAWTPQEAYDEIVSQRGKQFDPQVVDAFVQNYPEFLAVVEQYPDEPELHISESIGNP